MQHDPIDIHTLTIQELGDAAEAAGVMPSDLLAGLGLRLVASEPED